jgi:tRNA threonylcarbamoyladenosine biosynthesis protein TsaE
MGVRETVPSPTFALVQEYETARGVLLHVDLYRVRGEGLRSELARLGLRERRRDGAILLVEWGADAVGALGGDPVVVVTLAVAPDGGASARVATLTGRRADDIV